MAIDADMGAVWDLSIVGVLIGAGHGRGSGESITRTPTKPLEGSSAAVDRVDIAPAPPRIHRQPSLPVLSVGDAAQPHPCWGWHRGDQKVSSRTPR